MTMFIVNVGEDAQHLAEGSEATRPDVNVYRQLTARRARKTTISFKFHR